MDRGGDRFRRYPAESCWAAFGDARCRLRLASSKPSAAAGEAASRRIASPRIRQFLLDVHYGVVRRRGGTRGSAYAGQLRLHLSNVRSTLGRFPPPAEKGDQERQASGARADVRSGRGSGPGGATGGRATATRHIDEGCSHSTRCGIFDLRPMADQPTFRRYRRAGNSRFVAGNRLDYHRLSDPRVFVEIRRICRLGKVDTPVASRHDSAGDWMNPVFGANTIGGRYVNITLAQPGQRRARPDLWL